MPKKQTKKKKPSFAHPTRHGKMHWKKLLFIVIFGAFGLVVAAAITAQVLYNRFVWDRLYENSSLKITLLIQAALEGLEELKTSPENSSDGKLLIKEARLKLPAETTDVRKVLYYYNPATSGTDGTGYTWNESEYIQITTQQLASLSRNKLLTGMSVEEVFNYVPEAQACNRGFSLYFEEKDDNGLTLSGTVVLKDGRTLYVYREPACVSVIENVDKFEAYLLKAESY